LSTSAKPLSNRALYKRDSLCDLTVAAILILFGGVYESFSFGVFSFYMIYAFAPFFLLGMGELILSFFARFAYDRPGLYFFRWAACAGTAGSVVRGIVEIFGTSSELTAIYPVLFYAFLLIGILRVFYRIFIKKEEKQPL